MNGCARDHDKLVASLLGYEAAEDRANRTYDLGDDFAVRVSLLMVKAFARRCGWVEGSEHFLTFARRRVESYGRAIADGWPSK